MSTPAENTRYKAGRRHDSKSKSEVKGNMPNRRQDKQILKANIYATTVNRRNQLVKNWLVKSHGIKVSSSDKGVKCNEDAIDTDSWARLSKHTNPFDSNHTSEVSEELLNFKGSKTGTSYKSVKSAEDMNTSAEGSIGVGHSAMSGRSSTARRRLEKSKRLREMKMQHGHEQVKSSLDKKTWLQTVDHANGERGGEMCSTKDSQEGITQPEQKGDMYSHDQRNRSHDRNSVSNNPLDAENDESESNNGSNESLDDQVQLLDVEGQGNQHVDADEESQEQQQIFPSYYEETLDQNRDEEQTGSPKQADTTEEKPIDLSILDEYKKRLEENDSSVYYDMFELIITKLAVVQSNINQVRSTQKLLDGKVSSNGRTIDVCTQSIDDIDAEIDDLNDTNIKLVQSAIKNEMGMLANRKEVAKIVKVLDRGSFMLYGLLLNKDSDVKAAVSAFIKNQLEIQEDIEITSAHRMGATKNAPVWFRLYDPDDIAKIFKNVPNLKDKTNAKGKSYRIKEFMDEERKAEKTRHQDIKMENYRLPQSHKLTLAYKKDDLYVNDKKYVKAIKTPQVKDTLLLNKEQENNLFTLPLHEGKSVDENGSYFQVYAAEVESHEQIQEMYQAVQIRHISASQVFCGYRVFGSSFHKLQDFVDAQEHGGGKSILDAIKATNVWNISVFIVRYHNGPNLGARRYQIINDMTKQVIASFPRPLNYGQYFTDQVTLKHLNSACIQPEREQSDDQVQHTRGRPRNKRGNNNPRARKPTKSPNG